MVTPTFVVFSIINEVESALEEGDLRKTVSYLEELEDSLKSYDLNNSTHSKLLKKILANREQLEEIDKITDDREKKILSLLRRVERLYLRNKPQYQDQTIEALQKEHQLLKNRYQSLSEDLEVSRDHLKLFEKYLNWRIEQINQRRERVQKEKEEYEQLKREMEELPDVPEIEADLPNQDDGADNSSLLSRIFSKIF